ncbi:unnamed protein product [Phytophthora lilii]|uniref:Unnamed protein product n=1 Tax=Phytophthora lilii TaxID=2077276 RepID=A0A9W7CLZ4_9STRA|nr:unnamed protein product [Phytophthora lilii]
MEARASHQEANSARSFHQKLLELPELPPSGCGDNCSAVVDWIDTQLRGLDRVEAYKQTMVSSRKVGSVGIYTAGMNGQLPNLDLVNTAVRAFRQHQIPIILDRADEMRVGGDNPEGYVSSAIGLLTDFSDNVAPDEFKQGARSYLSNLKGMLHFMTTLALGPSGPHANFISYNIDSITLSLTKSPASGYRSLSSREVIRSVEMVIRALSNLEEKLHQSFFLYVLPSTTTFVSVGEYFYTVALAISPAIAHLLYLANKTSGMRIALGLTVFLVVEVLCALLLVGVSAYSTGPTFASNRFVKKWWSLAIGISFVQILVVGVVLPGLRSMAGFSGCVEIYDWRKKLANYEADKLRQVKNESVEEAAGAVEPAVTIPELDPGWRAVKFITMAVLVYVNLFDTLKLTLFKFLTVYLWPGTHIVF